MSLISRHVSSYIHITLSATRAVLLLVRRCGTIFLPAYDKTSAAVRSDTSWEQFHLGVHWSWCIVSSCLFDVQCGLSPVCSNDDTVRRNGTKSSEWSSQMEHMLLSKPGLGTRCMDASVHTIRYAAIFSFVSPLSNSCLSLLAFIIKQDWLSASVINHAIVTDPTVWQPCFDLHHRTSCIFSVEKLADFQWTYFSVGVVYSTEWRRCICHCVFLLCTAVDFRVKTRPH